MILTHPDQDHISGLVELLKDEEIKIDNLIVNFNENKFIDFIDVNKINEYLENILNIKLSIENSKGICHPLSSL